MSTLTIPTDNCRIRPMPTKQMDAYVKSEYTKSINTWGIPNNLFRTMAWLPRLALTEVDYANSFIFDQGPLANWPDPSSGGKDVLLPEAGFVDRVTKELAINLVSLLNRSRYSITHHTVIGFNTLSTLLPGPDSAAKSTSAEMMLLHLVNGAGEPTFEGKTYPDGRPVYSDFHLAVLRLAQSIQHDPHSVTDMQFDSLRSEAQRVGRAQISAGPLAAYAQSGEFCTAYVNGMLVELTWCIVHFNGLLNAWFTVLHVQDEQDVAADGIDFVQVYNTVVPESIKVRNNRLLGSKGWGR
jgi:hypothetical protein